MARPRLIDREAILDAALVVADREGLDGVTMRAIAERLGVTTMALYRHVPSKAELLDGVVERLLLELPTPGSEQPWDEQLRLMAADLRTLAKRHSGAFPLLLQRPASTFSARQVRDRVRGVLLAAGVPGNLAANVERLLSTTILGFAASEALGRFRGLPRSVVDQDFDILQRMLLVGIAEVAR